MQNVKKYFYEKKPTKMFYICVCVIFSWMDIDVKICSYVQGCVVQDCENV